MQPDLFYNTVNLSGDELKIAYQKAFTSTEAVKTFFTKFPGKEFTPAQVWQSLTDSGYKYPLTSIRRSITNLEHLTYLEKTNIKRIGIYGAKNYCWKLK